MSSLEDTPPLPNALGPGLLPALSFRGSFDWRHLPQRTSIRRRALRANELSTERTVRPSGSIQKPTTGKKPTIPPTTSPTPRITR